jgi:hypothetical protein
MFRNAARRDNGVRDTSYQRTAWPRLEDRTSLGVEARNSPSASMKRLSRWRSGITIRKDIIRTVGYPFTRLGRGD